MCVGIQIRKYHPALFLLDLPFHKERKMALFREKETERKEEKRGTERKGSDTNNENRPRGDFIISYHPKYKNLFLATGGSGHAYKFLPVIGEKVVDALEERLEGELRDLWTWTETATGTETRNEKFRNGAGSDTDDEEDLFDGDGSRSGERRLNLREELARMRKDGSSRGSVL